MITAEKARQNAEYHRRSVEEAKAKLATEFVNKIVEPAIIEASMHGKNEVAINTGECLDAITQVIGIITEAGFKIERGRNDAAIRITW